jgi:hypothetical protein
MLNYNNSTIEKISVHRVGNKTNGEEIGLSKTELILNDNRLKEILIRYFLRPFAKSEYFSFTAADDDFTKNTIFNSASRIFDNSNSFHETSISIAEYLYEVSEHPNIKSGDLFVVYFNDIIVDDEITCAVGIFKSENRQPFLKVEKGSDNFSLLYEDGINIDKLDKGCLIMDTERKIGFRVCSIDNSNKSVEAQYWKDTFLQLKPFNDDFYFTKQVMAITKNYVVDHLPDEQDIDNIEQIDLLNRSADYFKSNDNYSKKDFEDVVLQDEGLINSYRKYNQQYMQEHDMDLADTFEISPEAVKNQSRIFKSILKLDKNFHIYIHGDTDRIRRGEEPDGRKYYKLYFDKEST